MQRNRNNNTRRSLILISARIGILAIVASSFALAGCGGSNSLAPTYERYRATTETAAPTPTELMQEGIYMAEMTGSGDLETTIMTLKVAKTKMGLSASVTVQKGKLAIRAPYTATVGKFDVNFKPVTGLSGDRELMDQFGSRTSFTLGKTEDSNVFVGSFDQDPAQSHYAKFLLVKNAIER